MAIVEGPTNNYQIKTDGSYVYYDSAASLYEALSYSFSGTAYFGDTLEYSGIDFKGCNVVLANGETNTHSNTWIYLGGIRTGGTQTISLTGGTCKNIWWGFNGAQNGSGYFYVNGQTCPNN